MTYEKNMLKSGNILFDEYTAEVVDGEIGTVSKGSGAKTNEKFVTIVEQTEEGKIQAGDELAIKTEHFYVVSSNESETVLLAKYNLYVGNIYDSSGNKMGEISEDEDGYGIQNETAICYSKDSNEYIGTVAFSLTNYWDGNVGEGLMYPGQYSDPNYPNIYDVRYSGASNDDYSVAYYVENYKDELEKMGATNIKARMLTYQEIKNLGCDTNSGICTTVADKNKFVYSTSYWLSSGVSNRVWSVYSFGKILDDYFNLNSRYGVRPVIVVNTSDIEI